MRKKRFLAHCSAVPRPTFRAVARCRSDDPPKNARNYPYPVLAATCDTPQRDETRHTGGRARSREWHSDKMKISSRLQRACSYAELLEWCLHAPSTIYHNRMNASCISVSELVSPTAPAPLDDHRAPAGGKGKKNKKNKKKVYKYPMRR